MGGAAIACPSGLLATDAITYSGLSEDPFTALSRPVTAGGDQTLEACGLGILGTGQFRSAPDYSFNISDMAGRHVVFDVESDCDPALLVQTSDGQWLFNDDTNGLNPAITIEDPAQMSGTVHVWVGTFMGGGCEATLNLTNVPEDGSMPVPLPDSGMGATDMPTPVPLPLPAPTPTPAPAPMPVQQVVCPNPAFTGQPLTFAASQLVQPQSLSGTAMGSETRVYDCPGVDGGGTATQAPQYTMYLSGMQGYELQLEANGSCDTTLLAYGADGQWYYNDDGAGDLQPRLTIPAAAANGQLSVWMGTFGGQSCPATLTAQAISLAPPTPVSCPNPAIPGPPLNFTAAQLLQPQAYSIQATGSDTRVADCPGVDGGGSATAMPQTSLYLSGMQGYELQLEANGSCDTTLLVHGADGQWYYDDDGAGNLQPSLTVPGAALNGRVDVWVGTFGGGSCPATFTLQASQLAPPPPPQGCPNPAFSGQPITASGDNLRPDFGYTLQTTAAGSTALGECTTPGRGYANAAPNFSLYLSDMQRYGALEIEVNSSCDTTLLVRDAFGQWHFDDDSAGSLMPLLRLTNTAALNGRVDVWVGTYGGGSCAASLALRSQF
ncbi:hypothetical protein roselon_02391 [Roseibacterium elongatum DSM 19469]|uniref:Uncharacterized protein n=2 Tax=Roseicyclus elongatus TaxID=159346 RepID=W8RU26_9RHOB|nr:hypothetical protein roselon_02391 [Roseibacterium elongatum DSM 19469]